MNKALDINAVDYERILRALPSMYLILRANIPDFTIVAVSDVHLKTTNRDRNIIGEKLFEVFPDNPSDNSAVGVSDLHISLCRVIESKKQDIMGVQRYDIPRPDNPSIYEPRYWTIVNTPLIEDDGSVEFIINSAEDVTEFILLKEKSLKMKEAYVDTPIAQEQIEAHIFKNTEAVKELNREIKNSNIALSIKQNELKTLNDELKRLDQVKTEFFSNISHEFRTPLTLMLGPIEDILQESNLNDSIKYRIDILHRNCLRLLKLVNTLLDFSRLEAGKVHATFRPVDLSKITTELASHFDSAVERSGLILDIKCPPLPEPIYVDIDLYEKIILNLLSNAFKHTFSGTIEVGTSWLGNSVEIWVKDTGVGIPEEQLLHIFKRFHRVPNAKSRTYEGSGIGLSLVQELVKVHQGTIIVNSNSNQGTTFKITLYAGHKHLPIEHVVHDSNLSQNKQNVQSYVQESIHWFDTDYVNAKIINNQSAIHQENAIKKKILLADDNHDMRNYISRLLEQSYEVISVANGLDALRELKIHIPDLILSDVMMPIMNGFELVNAIRKDPEFQSLPIIMLSARAGAESKIEGLEAGVDDYLIKPFNVIELLTRIKTNLNLQSARLKTQETIRKNLEKTAKLKDQFISNMSHELRTPLNAIIGYSDMILKGMADSEETQRLFINNISTAGRHLLVLINDILDLSKIEAGKFSLYPKWFRINEFIQDIQGLIKELAANKHVMLDFEFPEDFNDMYADPVRLKQILINLLNNAIKFNKEHGQVKLSIEKSRDEKWVIWRVSDTGIGIPKDKLNELFTEFYQVDNSSSRAYEGTGLGLALSKKLIQLHGGTISVESQENVGSIFSFILPALQISEAS